MKFYSIFFLIILLCINSFSSCNEVREIVIEKNYTESSGLVEDYLKENASSVDIMVFTHVPRGLVVSIDEDIFFNDKSSKIKSSAFPVLNDIADVLSSIDSSCVVEGHTEKNNFENEPMDYNWELSLLRAGNIVSFLIKYGKIPADRLFSLGFGEYMPSVDNVSEKIKMNKRIDFIFIDYEKNISKQ